MNREAGTIVSCYVYCEIIETQFLRDGGVGSMVVVEVVVVLLFVLADKEYMLFKLGV